MTYVEVCQFCDEPTDKGICPRCRQIINRMVQEMAQKSEIGRQMQRRLTAYGNWPARPEITGGE